MGNQASVPEKVYKAAKQNDVLTLKTLLRELYQQQSPGQSIQALGVLEFKDGSSFTPLVVASARANYAAAELLLQHGANVHYVTNLPEASTSLHEAVQKSHDGIVELLLRYGANAFLENGRGLTPIDLAINNRHVKLVRRVEQRAFFAGWLLMKVPKYMGLGSEWKSRWCVIMPRYPSPGAARAEQVVRTLLVCYKGIDQAMPCCKVWLDGATPRTVTGSRGSSLLQCMLALHRNHSPPTGAHVTGDATSGFSLHLRPIDDTNAANGVLRRFMDVCGGNRQPQGPGAAPAAAPQRPAAPTPQRQPSNVTPQRQSNSGQASAGQPSSGPPPLAQPPSGVARPGPVWGPPPSSGAGDEEYARQLQAQFDAENGRGSQRPSDKGGPPAMPAAPPRPSYTGPSTSPGQQTGPSYPAPSSSYPAPYPSVDGPLGQHLATNSAAVNRNQGSSGGGGGSGMYPSTQGFAYSDQQGGARGGATSQNPFSSMQGPAPTNQHGNAAGVDASGRQNGGYPSSTGNVAGSQAGEEGGADELAGPSIGQGAPVADSNPRGAWWNQLPSAPQPPPAAAQDMPSRTGSDASAGSPSHRMAPTGQASLAAMQDDDSDMCVVCMEQPCVAGFVHGNSVHKCCCRECAEDYKRSGHPTCPICREPIEHVITKFY